MSIPSNIDIPISFVNRKNYSNVSDNIGMSIGNRVREARKEAGLTQPELAAKVGIKQPTLSDLETGKSEGTTYIATIAAALKVNALWLQTGNGDKKASNKTISFTELNGLEAQLVMLYRSLSGSRKDALLLEANRLVNEKEPDKATASNPFPQRRKGDAVDQHATVRITGGKVDQKKA